MGTVLLLCVLILIAQHSCIGIVQHSDGAVGLVPPLLHEEFNGITKRHLALTVLVLDQSLDIQERSSRVLSEECMLHTHTHTHTKREREREYQYT
jgi:hypothetical protein